jgi:hypothetical protein
MAVHPSVGPWPLFQFLGPVHSRQDSLNGGSARRKAAIYTQNKRIQTSLSWVGLKSTIPAFEQDRAATVIGDHLL